MATVQSKQWYVIFCKPHQERQVCGYLRTRGFEVYCPTYPVQHEKSPTPQGKPLFPRYLFVQADLATTGISALNWIPGAVGLVTYGNTPASVPQHIIHELKRRLTASTPNSRAPTTPIKPGAPVRIVEGPLAAYEAFFDASLSSPDRVRVLLHLLDRQVKVSINANAIETL